MQVSIEEIKVKKNRVRKEMGDLVTLKDSMKRYGLLNPITLDANKELIAGHRRLEAAKMLGWTSINAVTVNNATKINLLEIEMEENIQRLNFTDAELMDGYTRLERLRNPSFFRRIWNAIVEFFTKLFGKKK